MKIFRVSFLILAVMSLFIACTQKDEDTGQLKIEFEALFNGQPLIMNEVVDFNGSAMRINVSEFYISDIQLSNSSGSVMLSENDSRYVNFTSGESTLSFDDVPINLYDKLTFYIGVPANLNAMKPENFSSSQALSRTSTYWEDWQSYIFNRLEGRLDTNGDGETELVFVYHSGTNDLYQKVEVTLTNGIDIRSGVDQVINLNVEHRELFNTTTGTLDIAAKPSTHGRDDLDYQKIILENFVNGVNVE